MSKVVLFPDRSEHELSAEELEQLEGMTDEEVLALVAQLEADGNALVAEAEELEQAVEKRGAP